MAIYSRDTSGANTTRYLLHDHLGSVAEVTNASGGLYVAESFAAFGGRRDASDWQGAVSSGDESLIANLSQRGFTFHEHLESSDLVHMNGRVMDTHLGRFISADPYIPDATNTQAFNRYSYVYNDVLSYIDPDGFNPQWGVDTDLWEDGLRVRFSWSNFEIRFGRGARGGAKGCLGTHSATPCYGMGNANKLPDVGLDTRRFPFPGIEVPEHLVIYCQDPLNNDPWWNERQLAKDIGHGIYVEFVVQPVKDLAQGKVFSAACKFVKLCKAVVKTVGAAGGYVVDKLRRRVDDVPRGTTPGYRAVSNAELDDIAENGFRPHPGGRSMEDKWFSESREGAEAFRNKYDDLDNIVEADVPNDVLRRSHRDPNIDGTGPGFAVRPEDQPLVRPRTGN